MSDTHANNANDVDPSSQVPIGEEPDELTLLKKKCEEYLAGWQRAKADYSNLKRENEKNREEFVSFANAALLAELIPVYDNFKKAFSCAPTDNNKEWNNWMTGIGYIKKQMWDFIQKFGVEEIETVGKSFDPELHESVGIKKSEEHSSGDIIKEVYPGYTIHGKLLSPAKVIVAE